MKGKQFEYPIYIDVEENRHQQIGKSRMAEAIKGFCEYLEGKGYYVGIYANSNYFNNFIDTAKLSMYDKWLAVWTSNKPSFKYGDYGLWQNSSSGYISGMRVDTDYAYKDYPTIIKKAGLNGYSKGTPETPKVEPTKKSNDENVKNEDEKLHTSGMTGEVTNLTFFGVSFFGFGPRGSGGLW